LTNLDNLAQILKAHGKIEAAEQMKRRILASYEKVHGPNHHYTLLGYCNLALVLMD
jgi:hypothetical protein